MVETIVEIITRTAVADFEFRQTLLNNPGEILAEYDLTDDERTSLSTLEAATFDASVGDLESRLSRGTSFN
jgi:hypothetical protein